MPSNTRITRSKGEPEAVSLPSRTSRCKKSTTMDDQWIKPTPAQSTSSPTMPAEDAHGEARCQSTHPQDQHVRMRETPVPALQPVPARPLTPVYSYQSRKILDHAHHKCLPLSSWKTGAQPAWRMKQQLAMQRLLSSITKGHHHD